MKISRWPMGLLFVAMLAMVATDVMAQRGGEGGRPGGGGARGGSRGGSRGSSMGGRGGGGLAGLLQIKEVREEIELMPDQEEALKKIKEDQPQSRPQRPEIVDRRNPTEDEKKKISEWVEKMGKQRAEAAEKLHGQLEEILLPDQLERLEQLEVQQLRTGALTNKRVLVALKLTTEQQEDLKKTSETARGEMMKKMREMFQGGGGDRDAMREKMAAASKEVEDKLMSVLTSDQKQEFAKLKGKAFEFPRSERRGGGRPAAE